MTVDNKSIKVKTVPSSRGQARITCPPQLANGLDTLKVSFWVEWNDNSFFEELETLKRQVQFFPHLTSLPYHCPGGFDWNVHRTGTALFTYRLSSGDLALLVNTRSHEGNVPNVRFEIGSQSCWMPGYNEIFDRFTRWISALGGSIIKEIISEVHLTADLIGLPIAETNIQNQNLWVSQAKYFSTYNQGRLLSGISIGRGDTSLRIYDKVMELRHSHHKQETFSEIWKTKTYDEKPVTRVEFQLRRPILKDFKESKSSETGIDTYQDLISSLPVLWEYCTQIWSKHCTNPVDHENNHQSRAKISEFWKTVSNVSWNGISNFTKEKSRPNKDIIALRKQYRGIGMTIASFSKVHVADLDHIIGIAKDTIEDELISFYRDNETEFIKRMEKKKREIYDAVSSPNPESEASYG